MLGGMKGNLTDENEVAAREMAADAPKAGDAALACFILMLKFLRVPADPEQLQHERGRGTEPFTFQDLLRAAKRLSVEAKHKRAAIDRLERLPLPAIAKLRGAGEADGEAVLLLRAERENDSVRLLIQRPYADGPEVLDARQAKALFTGDILLLTTRERLAGQTRTFDVSWFIPALVKYRKPLRDVLLASFFIQIIALVSPIFFQLVIDKVLVHHALTTLHVLAVGLAVVSIWEILLSGLRTWLFAHTTNRIDAELGAQLFRHLLNLPLSYFEARRVGDSVARVRELETIREFLTSNTLTLVIDLVFTIVFFAVMYAYSPLLTLVVVFSIPLYIVISVLITPPLRARLDEKFKRGLRTRPFWSRR
ncbi:ABC transporter transmembrane domain-containing protein [Pedomonas mirosovicensis]|uniref:ABC transporter transmembrane domain-containing protein n=1 Tax=Pedomonas mirosovicensis TaxID=2908641 RepID=UPI00286F3E6C|nr:ABC transporter transmembrane domain-containing protein [Pedomonas mirosovicensis]